MRDEIGADVAIGGDGPCGGVARLGGWTLGEVANLSYYHELPTVSRDSMRRVAGTVRALLERAANGEQPLAADAVSATRR